MGLVYLPTFTIHLSHMDPVNLPVPWIRHGCSNLPTYSVPASKKNQVEAPDSQLQKKPEWSKGNDLNN